MSSREQTNEIATSSRSNRNNTSKDDNINSDASTTADDKLFEPSLEMMVNDFDDESTLELEERIASTEASDPNAELNSLQRVCCCCFQVSFISSYCIIIDMLY